MLYSRPRHFKFRDPDDIGDCIHINRFDAPVVDFCCRYPDRSSRAETHRGRPDQSRDPAGKPMSCAHPGGGPASSPEPAEPGPDGPHQSAAAAGGLSMTYTVPGAEPSGSGERAPASDSHRDQSAALGESSISYTMPHTGAAESGQGAGTKSRIGLFGDHPGPISPDKSMSRTKEVVLATGNQHKLREFGQLLDPFGLKVTPAEPGWLEGVEETGASFVENALIKARAVSARTGHTVIADDSGLVVDALGGEPGIYSARYAGAGARDEDNNRKLLAQLLSHKDRSAYFYCVIVSLRHSGDPCPLIFTGRWDGQIARAPSGQDGFGYDPLFYLESLDQTAAQMSAAQKNSLSHRGRAARQLVQLLCQEQSGQLGHPGGFGLAASDHPT